MASKNTVNVKFKVTEDGGLERVGKSAEKAATNLNNTGKSAGELGRNMKGAAGATSNTSKEFAKMSQGMGGLVGAYATLAANVFALSSAFEFFKRAADVRLLQQSQMSFAQTTGRALQTVTQQLRDASSGMLGFREAAEAAAIGAAKGFSPKQLEDLARGAQKASAALGRGFEDSFDRLIRGASKAEPELLDELGITLKLADATEKYAESIGMKADALTATQRSQAVLLETQRQLTEMYGEVETGNNVFVELGKTFNDLLRKATDFVMPVAEFIANILNRSAAAAVVVFGALGLSILKMMLPIDDMKGKMAEWSDKSKASLEASKQALESYRLKIKEVAAEQARAATASAKTSARGMLAHGVGQNSKLIQKAARGQLVDPKQVGQLKRVLRQAEKEIKKHGVVRNGVLQGANQVMVENMNRSLKAMDGPSYTFFQTQGMRFQKLALRGKVAFEVIKTAGVNTFRALGKAGAAAFKVIDKAMRLAGIIGVLMIVWDLIKQVIESPLTIAKSILGGIDTVFTLLVNGAGSALSWIGKVIDKFISGTTGAFASMANGLVSFYDSIIQGVLSGINFLLEGYNKAAAFFGREKITLLDEDATPVKDLVGQFEGFTSNVEGSFESLKNFKSNLAGSFESTGFGTFLAEHEAAQDALKVDQERLETLNTILEKSGKDIQNVADGYEKLDKARKSAIQSAKDEGKSTKDLEKINNRFHVKRAQMAAQLIADLDIGSRFDDINLIKDPETKNKALESLRKEMSKLGIVSGRAYELMQAGDVEGLKEFTRTQREAIASSAAVKDAVSNTNNAIDSGNWYQAAQAIENMQGETAAAAKGFREQLTPEGDAAADSIEKFTETALRSKDGTNALNNSIKEIIETMQRLNEVTITNTLLGGKLAEIRNAQLASDQQRLKVLELETKLSNAKEEDKDKIQKELDLANLQLKVLEAREAYKTQGDFGGGVAASSVLMEQSISVLDDPDKKMSDKIAAMGNVTNPMVENLKKLGPQGEAVSAAIEGSFLMAESWSTAFEKINAEGATSGDKVKAGLEAGLATVSAMSSMMAAKSKAAIAGIDKEIEAEKKRDGKSAESLAKIKQLEARKEKMKRKAFEQDKKMKMAEVVIATGVAIMNSVKMGLPWGAPFGAMAAAMGAAQLSAISSMTYNGGGSASNSAPSNVSVGSRDNTVDLAKAASPAGELAYARGSQGMGNMTNFTPAFTGYRAAGGNTAFMVGEQGPEMFVPERPGTIVPADETAGTMGAPVTANINISAVDAEGVEQVLMRQRGNIIGMIREAANANGETFLESVSTMEV